MQMNVREFDGALLIEVDVNRIDASGAVRFKDLMCEHTTGRTGRIVLDLARVDFIDSSGLGAIVAAMKRLDGDQTLELASLSPTVAKVFRLTRMDTVFKIHETPDNAMTKMTQTG